MTPGTATLLMAMWASVWVWIPGLWASLVPGAPGEAEPGRQRAA